MKNENITLKIIYSFLLNLDKKFDLLDSRMGKIENRLYSFEKDTKLGFEKVHTEIDDLAIAVGKETLDIRNRIDILDNKIDNNFITLDKKIDKKTIELKEDIYII